MINDSFSIKAPQLYVYDTAKHLSFDIKKNAELFDSHFHLYPPVVTLYKWWLQTHQACFLPKKKFALLGNPCHTIPTFSVSNSIS